MKNELQQKFYDRWPEWFAGRNEGMQVNLMCFGFEHDDGWFDLEWRLCEDLEKILGQDSAVGYKLFQIKEKFGTLRWYDEVKVELEDHANTVKAISERVRQAENESAKTCEQCGKPGSLHTTGTWLKTVCAECAASSGRFKPFSQDDE
jgi:hypothetical protein